MVSPPPGVSAGSTVAPIASARPLETTSPSPTPVSSPGLRGHQRRRPRRGVPQGVADQVRDDPFHDRRVGHDRGQSGRDVRKHRPCPRPEGSQRVRDDLVQIRRPGEYRQRPGLQPAHVQQARRDAAEQIEGPLGRVKQFGAIARGEAGVTRPQAAHRRLGRGERRPQVVADRREQRRPPAIGLSRELLGGAGRHPAPPWPVSVSVQPGTRGAGQHLAPIAR
jgi:hypothetical protein